MAAMKKRGTKAQITKWARQGGRRRALSLTPERRREIAAKAAQARWGKVEPTP